MTSGLFERRLCTFQVDLRGRPENSPRLHQEQASQPAQPPARLLQDRASSTSESESGHVSLHSSLESVQPLSNGLTLLGRQEMESPGAKGNAPTPNAFSVNDLRAS
eukprot:3174207-Rhodomonas_salina.3